MMKQGYSYKQCSFIQSSILLLMHQYTKSENVEALSIFNQNIKEKAGEKPNRKHLLGLLSSFTREQAQVKNQQVEELCCFDRMKKLIGGRNEETEVAKKDQISSIVIEQKINQMEANISKNTVAERNIPKFHKRASSSNNYTRRSCIVEDLKKDCLQKFLNHQLMKRDTCLLDTRKMIQEEVQIKVDAIIQDRQLQFRKLQQDNQSLRKNILSKQLQIQALRVKEVQMKDYIRELEERSNYYKETKKPTSLQASQNFYEKFVEVFGDFTIQQLKRKLDFSIEKCLDGFEKVENKNQIKIQQQKKAFEHKINKMQNKISQLKSNENDLIGNLRTLKLNKHLSEIEEDGLLKAKHDLQNLQKLILALYTEWHEQRSNSQKKVLKNQGCLSENYSYEEMLKYIVEYGKKFSTNDKLNDYLFKILRGIQKLKRIIYPQQSNQKLDPLATIERIQKWVKFRVDVPTPARKQTVSNEGCYLTQN